MSSSTTASTSPSNTSNLPGSINHSNTDSINSRNGFNKFKLDSDTMINSGSSLCAINNLINNAAGANSVGPSANLSTGNGYNSSSSAYSNGNSTQNSENNNNTNDNLNNNNNNNNHNNGDDNGSDEGDHNHIFNKKKSSQQNQRYFTNGQKDILRLIGQHLRYLGLNKTTETLINESGCMLEHPTAANFCSLIMSGRWDQAEIALNDLRPIMDESNNELTFKNMKFLILEQKYLECLEDGKILEALKCLRDELAPLKFNTERLHELSSFLMCSDQLNLKALSKWSGKSDTSRQNLMDKLQKFLPPNIMLPPRRLESLLYQAIDYQSEKCPYHNFKDKPSLDNWSFLRDHVCSIDDFPTVTLQIINDHCDEIWYCKFSNNGKKLASGSKDGCLIIWDVDPETYRLTINKTYEDHSCGVAYVAWSPDDRYLIVCGTEESSELWIWDIENKTLKKRLNNNHDDSLTSAAWMPDGQSFVTGGIKGHFYNCDLDGNIRETWEGVRVRGLQTLSDGTVLAADSLKRIRSYNFKEISDANLIQEDFLIMSFTLNKSGSLILVSVAAQGVHLWDTKDKVLVRRFQGPIQNNYMNYASFGGADEIYLVSGSEDSRVYIWNIKKESPICILEGHTRSVTCVTWNPEIPGMIVSASDDGTLRVWGPKIKQSNNQIINSNNPNECCFNNDQSRYASYNFTRPDNPPPYPSSSSSSSSSSTSTTSTTTNTTPAPANNRSDRSTPV